METLELNKLADDQLETELKTLQGKKDASPEEKEKLQAIKEERTTRYQKRLDKLTWEKKQEADKSAKLAEELATQKAEIEELKKTKHEAAKPIVHEEYIEYGNKKFYTDDSLQSMVTAGDLTPQQAYAHQQQRLKAEIKDEIEKEKTQKETVGKHQKIWEDDKAMMLKEYPTFDVRHKDHNPEDPLYKLASEIIAEDFTLDGQLTNPRALSLSIKRAKQILKTTDTRADVSEHHTVGRAGNQSGSSKAPVTLSAVESETAVRIYSNVINPATNRFYTEQEAIKKATKAKEARRG